MTYVFNTDIISYYISALVNSLPTPFEHYRKDSIKAIEIYQCGEQRFNVKDNVGECL